MSYRNTSENRHFGASFTSAVGGVETKIYINVPEHPKKS